MSQQALCFCQTMKTPAVTSPIRPPPSAQQASKCYPERAGRLLSECWFVFPPRPAHLAVCLHIFFKGSDWRISESEPAVRTLLFFSSIPGGLRRTFQSGIKPLMKEQRTKGDGRYPDISNDLCSGFCHATPKRGVGRGEDVQRYAELSAVILKQDKEWIAEFDQSGMCWRRFNVTLSRPAITFSYLAPDLIPFLPPSVPLSAW